MKLTKSKLREMIRDVIKEVSPPGWGGTVKAMKKHKDIDNPWALAWHMKGKGDKPHYKDKEGSPKKYKKYKHESINEEKFYAFWNNKSHKIDGNSLWDAKQNAITQLKIPKSKVGLLAIVNAKEHDKGGYRYESINEAREIGGYYLMKNLKDLANDAKRNGEGKLNKALMYLYSRINQSYRDIDLSSNDVLDLLTDPRGRKHSKDIPTWMIDDLFESKTNEAIQINIDDLLKNKKVKEIMKRLGIKVGDAMSTAKIVKHFMRNPSDLKAIGA